MTNSIQQSAEEFLLKEAVARRHALEIESIVLFEEFEQFLTRLFSSMELSQFHVAAVSPVIAEIPLAADRAEAEIVEIEFKQPFAADIDSIKKSIKSPSDIVYLANPNRLTGTTFSNSQLESIASWVNQGLLIIDEYFHDFSQLSALDLIKEFSHIVVIRPFQDWNSPVRSECGYAITNEIMADKIAAAQTGFNLTRSAAKRGLEIFDANGFGNVETKIIQKRAFEVAIELMESGVKSQFTPTDSILIQLSDPNEMIEHLKARDIRVERVGDSEILKNHVRYRITCTNKDKELVKAVCAKSRLIKKIPDKLNRTKSVNWDRDKMTIKSVSK